MIRSIIINREEGDRGALCLCEDPALSGDEASLVEVRESEIASLHSR